MNGTSRPKQIWIQKTESGWAAKRAGATRSSIGPQRTQAQAQQAAKHLARRTGGAEVITKGRDGKIRSSDTIARRDPNPPRDREH